MQMTVPPGSRLHGVYLPELRLPEDAAVVLIVRDGRSFVPDATTRLMRGDQALLVSARRSRPEAERRLRAVSRAGRLASWRGERGAATEGTDGGEGAGGGRRRGMVGARGRPPGDRRSAPMRFLFRPPAADATGLLSLPWDRPSRSGTPRSCWRCRSGASRGTWSASSRPAGTSSRSRRSTSASPGTSTALLSELEEEGLPTVSVLGICVDRPDGQEAILVTRYLEYSMSYRWLFSSPRGEHSAERLLDTMVELLVRLHLAGVFWGDCSLSNTLFRPDAGALAAYLVDAETVERHTTLSPGQRPYDVDLARERVGAELLDLQAGGLLPAASTPSRWPTSLTPRYQALWDEVTHEQVFGLDEQQLRIEERLQRLNDLGFDVGEVELITSRRGREAARRDPRRRARPAPPGAFRLTGLEVQERQARRLLNDMRAFRAYLEQKTGGPVPESFAAHRWLAEVYQPVVDAIPADLAGGLAPAEVFHEVLEHRWFLSEQASATSGRRRRPSPTSGPCCPRRPGKSRRPR